MCRYPIEGIESFDSDQTDVFLEITKEIICQNKIRAFLFRDEEIVERGEDGRRDEERVEDKP